MIMTQLNGQTISDSDLEWLVKLCADHPFGYTPKDVLSDMLVNDLQVWRLNEPAQGLAITKVLAHPGGNELHFWDCFGYNVFKVMGEIRDQLLCFAHFNGCKWLTATAASKKHGRVYDRLFGEDKAMTIYKADVPKPDPAREGLNLTAKVKTPDGFKAAMHLHVGDEIIGFDEANGEERKQKITHTDVVLVDGLCGGFGAKTKIWLGSNWREAQDLWEEVKGVRSLVAMTVEPDHTIVLADGTKVHNKMGGGSQSSTQKVEPWDEAKPFYERLYSEAENAYDKVPRQPYQGDLIAQPNRNQTLAWDRMQGLADRYGDQGEHQLRNLAMDMLSGKFLNPATNPTLQPMVDAMNRPIREQFMQEIIPSIGSQAQLQGAYGGSRQGIMEGQAAGDLGSAMLDNSSRIYYDNYRQERQNQLNSPALLAMANEIMMYPEQIRAQVGQMQQGADQSAADEALARYNMKVSAPFQGMGEWASILNGGGFSSGTSMMPRPSPLSGALQGTLGGAATGSAMGAVLPALAATGPMGLPIGVLGGAVLGGLGGLFG